MDFYLSQVILWSLDWAPYGWAICDGRQLPVNQYAALYSLIGNIYGGNNVNFNLPDLRGRAPIGYGHAPNMANYIIGKQYGAETSTIQIANLPPHAHTGNVSLTGAGTFAVSGDTATATVAGPNQVLAGAQTNVKDEFGNDGIVNIYGDPTNLLALPNALQIDVTSGGSFVTNTIGAGQAMANVSPVLAMNYIMLIEGGIYPVRP